MQLCGLHMQRLTFSSHVSILPSVGSFVILLLYQFIAIHSPAFVRECTAWHKTLVPLSWATRGMGSIVSYRYRNHVYFAVLAQVSGSLNLWSQPQYCPAHHL